MELSEKGKVAGVSWYKKSQKWEMQYWKDGKKKSESFIPKHYDLPTNSEQVRAAHRASVARREEFLFGLS